MVRFHPSWNLLVYDIFMGGSWRIYVNKYKSFIPSRFAECFS